MLTVQNRWLESKLLWFLDTSPKSVPQMSKFLPGTAPPEAAPPFCSARVRSWRAGARLRADAGGMANFRFAEEERFILSEERTLLRGVPETLARRSD
jgi:hypothetical protein